MEEQSYERLLAEEATKRLSNVGRPVSVKEAAEMLSAINTIETAPKEVRDILLGGSYESVQSK